MKVSDLIVRQLEEEGVRHIFGLPGEENLSFLESLRTSKINVHITRHEQAAAFEAAMYGRLTGKAGICFSTLGPGATNLVTGIAHAQLIGAPLVAITGQKALRNNRQARFQLIDVIGLMSPITKHSTSIADPGMAPTIIRNAFKLAQAERPGAVHIELPEDIAEDTTEADMQAPGYTRRPAPDTKALAFAAGFINGSRHPLILLAGGANRNLVTDEVASFVEKTGIYAVHTQMGKGVLSDVSEYSLFSTGIHHRDYVSCGIDRADLVITVGYNIVEYPPSVWNGARDKKIIHIDFTDAQLDRYYNPVVEVTGDISSALRSLEMQITPRYDDKIYPAIRAYLNTKLEQAGESKFPPSPRDVVRHVRRALDEDDIVALDNGIYKLWFCRLYKTYRRNTFLVDNALASMGAGLPSALTAKMLNPHRKVLAVVGDGGFMMSSQELERAVRYGLPVVVLILNDNAYGFIKWEQQAKKFPPFGLDLGNPDFVKFAESFGAAGFSVREGDNLSDILERAFALNRPAVVDCPIDYSLNYATFTEELTNFACEI